MSELNLVKQAGVLIPADPSTAERVERMKNGAVIRGDFKQARNSQFHRKYFALLNVGFELWEPGEIDTKWGKPEKNFEQYREQVQILAGFGEPVFNVDGTFRMRAKSISFANMDDSEFANLYSRVVDVILKNLGQASYTLEELLEHADRVVQFG